MNDRRSSLYVEVVVPTVGRPSLDRLLDSLAVAADACDEGAPWLGRVLLVDDRRDRRCALVGGDGPDPAWAKTGLADRVKVITGRAEGPAAARNDGWRAASGTWIAFLDDDVEVPGDWLQRLHTDPRGSRLRCGGFGRPHPGPRARGPSPHRLGAQRRRPRAGPMGHR